MRNRDYRAKMREKKKKKELRGDADTKTETASQASRIKSYDYRSWDKFDVVSVNAYILKISSKTHLQFITVFVCGGRTKSWRSWIRRRNRRSPMSRTRRMLRSMQRKPWMRRKRSILKTFPH